MIYQEPLPVGGLTTTAPSLFLLSGWREVLLSHGALGLVPHPIGRGFPPQRQTNGTENITFPRTAYAIGEKNRVASVKIVHNCLRKKYEATIRLE